MKIRVKLLVSHMAIAAAATLLVCIPVVAIQVSQLKQSIAENAGTMLNAGKDSIQNFLETPATIVKAMEPYANSESFNQHDAEKDFESVIKDYPSLSCLYWTDSLAASRGGHFYSSDGFIPDDDYDKTSQEWFQRAMRSQAPITTAPYVDEDTGKLVCTVAGAVHSGFFNDRCHRH
jgi:methyl-accepting chemotaxis protein